MPVDGSVTLPDGRVVPVWEGGEPAGAPVLFLSGTPSGRLQAQQLQEAAARHGVRLISFDRPGYGAAPMTSPGLGSVGVDSVRIRRLLGIDAWAVAGIAGGGPYAVAAAAVDRAVTRVAVVAGIGPWITLDGPDEVEAPLLALAERGELIAALRGFRERGAAELGELLRLPDGQLVDAYFAGVPAEDLAWLDAVARRRWALDARDALATYDGYARDNLSWAHHWDISLAEVRAPALLVYGEDDHVCPPRHGEWYAAGLAHAQLRVVPGAGHGRTCFGQWDTVLPWLTADARGSVR